MNTDKTIVLAEDHRSSYKARRLLKFVSDNFFRQIFFQSLKAFRATVLTSKSPFKHVNIERNQVRECKYLRDRLVNAFQSFLSVDYIKEKNQMKIHYFSRWQLVYPK
ncbi:hypothetical protein RF11_00173 [Thelohanellus kitauei]|uniref:Uncharacterized protein n=1 Tax=Thelohanellus kitauei TaxID=669202 RepID=A0A0C2IY63_THEKT|nr:hypothetical protein RF11_00173 [Thelohanellus kitauei]